MIKFEQKVDRFLSSNRLCKQTKRDRVKIKKTGYFRCYSVLEISRE